MKKIIITGCNGQLGRALNQELAGQTEWELINTDVAELDITDIEKVMSFVEKVKPYAILNCAAHTNVDACETQEELAYKINAVGPRNLSIAAKKTGAKMMHVSTDYVFPGDRADADAPYREFDCPGPKSVYGATKLAGEEFVKQFADRYFIIRTAWLYGDGKNFVKTMLRLSENHEEVSVVADQLGTPTSAKELAKAMLHLLPTENYGVFHGTCEGSCSWAEFAGEIFRLAAKNTRVKHVTSKEYAQMNPAAASRPAYSILDNYMLRLTTDYVFADWKAALAEYMSCNATNS